jgi:hypothetical protein
MSFLYRHTPLPKYITEYIYKFTKPKTINDYKYILSDIVMHHLLNTSSHQWNIQKIVDIDIFTQNIGYVGYSLYIGLIDQKPYRDITGSLKMYLVFDEFPLTPIHLLVLDRTKTIIQNYSLDKFVIGGFGENRKFYYNITPFSKLNTLEKNNWNRLVSNSTDLVNTLFLKHYDNKIPLSYTYIRKNIFDVCS